MVRGLLLALTLLLTLGMSVSGASAAYADDKLDPNAKVAPYGPPKEKPKQWTDGGQSVGITADRKWCILGEADGCNFYKEDAPIQPCVGADGIAKTDGVEGCTKENAQKFEEAELANWQKKSKRVGKWEELNAYLIDCVKKDHKPFKLCLHDGGGLYPTVEGPMDWLGGKISDLASDALQATARYIGEGVVWLLEAFATGFNDWSTIDLAKTGISPILGISLSLSVVIAVFLLMIQFGKVAISQDGSPLATAATGLAKWAAILAVYTTATQVALDWSDELSTWIINYTFEGGGSGEGDAKKAMETQLGKMFSGLTASGTLTGATAGAVFTGSGFAASAVAFVIVVGILVILIIAALWIEMMMRQAAIMVLVATMPIVLAGQMADATREWWPKARNALIALILMKPVIVICFAIGFSAMSSADGVGNILVGVMVFCLAGASWPALARFMTFTSNGEGNSTASGLLSTVGSTVSSMFGGYQPAPGGAGIVGGGAGYSRALEEDNANVANSGSNAAKGGFWSKVAGPVGMGLQLAAAAKDTFESTAQNTAANAGLGTASSGGRHVVIPPARRGAPAAQPDAQPSEDNSSEPTAPPAPGAQGEPAPPSIPPSGEAEPVAEPSSAEGGASSPRPAPPAPPLPEPSAIDPTAANWNGPAPTVAETDVMPRHPDSTDTEGS